MTLDVKLAEVVTALEEVGIQSLVMGGHAVRYYGLERMTDDFDLHLPPDCCDDLADRLSRSAWFRARNPVEFPSWRLGAFRRFQIGVLPNGREIWLEFWKENHLLPPFAEVFGRRESGAYGGRTCDFLSLADLIRSKETEREKDWVDIQYLEEFQDARYAGAVKAGELSLAAALARLRSRRGLETHLGAGNLAETAVVTEALAQATNPITIALLLPSAPAAVLPAVSIEATIESRLRAIAIGSPLHLTLVESVRRQYKCLAMEQDKADKRAVRERMTSESKSDRRLEGG